MEIRDDALDGPLHPELAPELETLVQPSLRLTRGEPADPASLATRLGGLPLLAPDAEWPRSDAGEPLSLVGVWNTNEINMWYGDRRLPPDLVVSFFYDAVEQRVWGFDPADRQFWRVVPAGLTGAVAVAAPEGTETFACWSLTPQRVLTLPDIWDPAVEGLIVQDDTWNAYNRLGLDVDEGTPIHRAFGWPEPQQGAMPIECQLVSNGIYTGDPTGYDDPRVPALKAGAADWLLLWQIDTDEDAGWMWGDMGTIYYWIRRQDLAVGDFDRVWMILQG